MNARLPVRAVGATLVLSLAACGGSDDAAPNPDVGALTPQQACEKLADARIAPASIGLPTRGATVTAAALKGATAGLPEYCAVSGVIDSVDTSAQPIRFALALPTEWNKRLMHLGGGGFNGTVTDVTTASSGLTSPPVPLKRGYAVVGSDSGHVAKPGVNIGTFALNEEELRNFTHEQLKKTRDVAVELIRQRYGTAQEKTYFIGGSEGGRESMMVVQRFPADYDGVFTLFPVFNWTAAMFKWLAIGNAMRADGGAGWLSPAKARLLQASEMAACDALDGVADGVISHVAACRHDPAVLRCPGGADTGDTCLSDAQIATTKVIYSRQTFQYAMANGLQSVPAYYPGAFFASSLGNSPLFDLASALSGTGGTTLGSIHNFGDAFTRFFIMRDANADTAAFDITQPGEHLARVQEVSALVDATDPDVSAFIARGGRWIMAHGLEDQLPLASATVEYYDSLAARYGRAELDKTLRFYTIPGFAHVGGSFAAEGGIPALDALEDWVERGIAPGHLVVSDMRSGNALRTRPMCVYPSWPKYKGSGDVNAAASFECVAE
ncbi:tannase/feruloyl esterase family alpha/beta hydrolase [Pseudorhodoferax sp. LjRoot39]|uniref:tannase/feruloyl esterase family alpha/beta hydrolase n=1 Tax=Pseudorhodoferax sp. LjRoot39 TaxID=3342328 RepID=UPI003ECE0B2F